MSDSVSESVIFQDIELVSQLKMHLAYQEKYLLSLIVTNLLLDCLRQLWMVYIIRTEHKYQAVDEMAKMVDNADMFRAQRNVYISGLAFALALVIKRVFTLVITLGRVREERDKYKKFFVEQKDS